ncbi:unnamed protein product [Mytilus coruscus]|uniref:Uncharacterized protein n=1 Tax=Mytilus coruscus TaxID=42192 RepID=A0A6J8EFI0_MYTCO|nr:unnamed protein product [Mytilus coruscus]
MQTILCLLLLSLSLMSCAINDCPRYNISKGKCRRGKAKSFLAFNARLLSSVPNKDDRLKELSGALLTENADVVCLNQVFLQDDIQTLYDDIKQVYPNIYSSIHDGTTNNFLPSTTSPCSDVTFLLAFRCMEFNCSRTTAIKDIIECDAQNNCNFWNSISQECLSCLLTIGAQCLTKPSNMNVAGNVILSKFSIEKDESSFYASVKQVNRQGKLIVEIAGRTIVCTNLQTTLNDEYYEPETKTIFSTWAEENLKQAECILENFRRQGKVMLMGDLECGPEIPSNGIRKKHLR